MQRMQPREYVRPPASDAGTARLSLLASAVAGRPLEVTTAFDDGTHTDGRTVFIGLATDTADVVDAVVAQSALLAAGSLHPDVLSRLRFHRNGVTQRYLALELRRAAVAFSGFLPPAAASRLTDTGHPVSGSSAESLRIALSDRPVPPPPSWAGGLKLSVLRRADPEDLRGRSSEPDGVAASFPGRLRNSLRKLLGSGETTARARAGAQEIAVGAGSSAPAGGPVDESLAVSEAPRSRGIRYPEWDCHRGRYRPAWCTVVETEPSGSDETVMANPAQWNSLARVGVELQRHRRQRDGDDLDLNALVDFHIDRARGGRPEPSVYENTLFTRRDLSVMVLLDCSGSTAENASGNTVFDEERQLAGEITAALERLGDQVATYGFNSWGRSAVNIWRIKDFGTRFGPAARRRLAATRPSGFTRMGAAIRHATEILENQALARNMVLLVIGDGLPYDDGYEDRYARADTRQAIEEAMRRGIGVVGLGVRSSTPPAILEEIWSEATFRVIGHAGEARALLRPMLGDALKLTRSNGRRRTLSAAADHRNLQHFRRAHRASRNSYV